MCIWLVLLFITRFVVLTMYLMCLAWFTILTPTLTSTLTLEMNPIPASTSASTSKDAADVEAVSLKFDAQLSVGVIL